MRILELVLQPLNLHTNRLQKWILAFVMILSSECLWSQNTSVGFTFNLSTSSTTSAGVFRRDGTLVKTLWNNVRYSAGTHSATWDRTNDDGLFLTDTGYIVKVVSNNVAYEWQGVVGNNSDSLTGSTRIRAFERIHTMASSGQYTYFSIGYGEAVPSCYKFNVSSPRNKINILHSNVNSVDQEAHYVATDGTYVYWAGFDPFNTSVNFVYATTTSNDAEVRFSSGTSVKMTFGRNYNGAINLYSSNSNAAPSGLAVQKNGSYLFVAHARMNQLDVLDKSSGALVQTLSYTSPREICTDPNGDLWMITGTNTLCKYPVNANGTLGTPTICISGLLEPLAMAVSPNGYKLMVLDGASSQQVKSFDNTSGGFLSSLGSAGGYINDPSVTNYKFYFNDSVTNLSKPYIAFQQDSSFWVGDVGNERAMHYSSAGVFIDHIISMPHSYSTVVDRNDPNRVFNEYLEFRVDYSKSLSPNNGSWTLVKNWRRGVKSGYFDPEMFNVFRQMITLSNGRTYALVEQMVNGIRKPELVELPSTGHMRYTGIRFRDFALDIIHTDGTLRRLVTSRNINDSGYWEVQQLTGFSNNNPVWGTPVRTAYLPKIKANDPAYYSVSFSPVTSTGINVVFCPDKENQGYHLGAVKNGSRNYLWRVSPSNKTNYKGPFPSDGTFDIGNNVEYAGGHVYALERSIFWNYHGEFWKNSQTNYWNHYYDNGLMIGQFGINSRDAGHIEKESFAMGAGNVFSSTLVKVGNDYYIYHNDESVHAGVHRWKVTGLNTIAEQTVSLVGLNPLTGQGLIGTYFNGADLNNFNMVVSQLESTVNLSTVPSQVTSSTNFSSRWTGYIQANHSQTYTMYARVSKGVRLWINKQLVINAWTNSTLTELSGSFTFVAGQKYSIKMEINGGVATLSWSSSSQTKQTVPSTNLYPDNIRDYTNGYNLMEGLEMSNLLEDGNYGWNRNSTSEINSSWNNFWHVETNVKSHLSNEASLSIEFANPNSTYSVTRDLGLATTCTQGWTLSGKIIYENNFPNWNATNAGYIDVLDDQNKVIARLTHEMVYINDQNKPTSIKLNGKAIITLNEKYLFSDLNNLNQFSISATSDTLNFSFGDYNPIQVKILDNTANWRKPKTLKFHFFGGDYQKSIDVRALTFDPERPATPVITNSSGLTKVCQGTPITLTAPQGISYQWSNLATTRSINVSSSGTYSVIVNYGNNCVMSSATTNIIVNQSPVPVITLNNLIMSSNYITGNQWYLNGNPIVGATAQTYKIFKAGSYALVVSDTNGCQGTAYLNISLPFKDVKFESKCSDDKKVELKFQTMDSRDEYKYGYEYSTDNGETWTMINELYALRTFNGNEFHDYVVDFTAPKASHIILRWYSLDENNERVQIKYVETPQCIENKFICYPNPMTDRISIELINGSNLEREIFIELFDINGKLVRTMTIDGYKALNEDTTIQMEDLGDLDNGVYQLVVRSEKTIYHQQKIMKL